MSTPSAWDDDFDVLPDTTEDESPRGWGDETSDANDQRLLDERPPHWS
ncbi:hypothetical protein [Phytoactinopolyspora alkaliphila]|nr:hypothetical protein [Phytoactinopolyspora alkaliphila]